MGSRVAHCATVEKAIDGLSISLWTDSILQYREGVCLTRWDPGPVQPMGELCTQLCRFTQGEKVVKMLLIHLILLTFGPRRQKDKEGRGLPSFTVKPPNVMEGAAHCIAMETQLQ